MDDCLCCAWLKDRTFMYVLLEDEYAIATLNDAPFREGHCTIWVKRHITSISEVSPEENVSVFTMITKISKALEQHYGAEKTWLLSIADQVKHIHYHLIPKLKGQISIGHYSFVKMMEAEGAPKPSAGELSTATGALAKLLSNQDA